MAKNNNTKFDFGTDTKKTEAPVANSVESKESTDVNSTETQANQPELTNNASDAPKDNKKADKKTNAEKAVVTYIGNGVWRDSAGECWSRTERKDADILSARSYDKSEYEEREDLKFMVKYGEMKLTLA